MKKSKLAMALLALMAICSLQARIFADGDDYDKIEKLCHEVRHLKKEVRRCQEACGLIDSSDEHDKLKKLCREVKCLKKEIKRCKAACGLINPYKNCDYGQLKKLCREVKCLKQEVKGCQKACGFTQPKCNIGQRYDDYDRQN